MIPNQTVKFIPEGAVMIQADSQDTRYQVRFSNRNHISFSDAGPDQGGQHKGFRPHELLEAALASSMNMTLRMAADKRAIPLTGARVIVSLNRTNPDEPVFNYSVELQGPLSDMQKELLLLALDTCPIRATITKPLGFRLSKR